MSINVLPNYLHTLYTHSTHLFHIFLHIDHLHIFSNFLSRCTVRLWRQSVRAAELFGICGLLVRRPWRVEVPMGSESWPWKILERPAPLETSEVIRSHAGSFTVQWNHSASIQVAILQVYKSFHLIISFDHVVQLTIFMCDTLCMHWYDTYCICT